MNYLLDTHTFLWTVFDPSKLGSSAKLIIQDPASHLHLSVLSFWEISLKYSLKKLLLQNCVPEDLISIAQKLGIEILDISTKEAAGFHHLPKMPHKDPFDRMIIWQAIQRKLVLISRDREVENYQALGLKTLW